jgi:type II secretory pathway pseudopilin PulG
MPAPLDTSRNTSRHERGFTMLEIFVVMFIVMVLFGIALLAFRSARSNTYKRDTETTASAYLQAIGQFQADHANDVPITTDMVQIGGVDAGPRNLLGQPYMKTLPDAVLDGRVSVDMSSCSGTGAGSFGHISYCAGPAPNFLIRVNTRPSPSAAWQTCYTGNWTSAAHTPICP